MSRTVVNIRWLSDDSGDDEKKRKLLKNSENAHKRLQELLNSMSTTKDLGSVNVIRAKYMRIEALENKTQDSDSKDIRCMHRLLFLSKNYISFIF